MTARLTALVADGNSSASNANYGLVLGGTFSSLAWLWWSRSLYLSAIA